MALHATTAEILDAYAGLSAEDLLALRHCARRLIDHTDYSEPLDLVHEAIDRALDGRRNWPLSVDFGVFMAMTMRSIADSDRKSSMRRLHIELSLDDLLWAAPGALPHARSPEDEAIASQELDLALRSAELTREALAGDDEAQSVLAGLLAGMSAREMRANLNLDAKAFDAARHRVMRRIGKEAPLH